jgi:hypothetical protein
MPDDEKALFEELQSAGWLYQDETIHWRAEKRNITVSQPTISATLIPALIFPVHL